MIRPARRLATFGACLACGFALWGCGVPDDGAPRAITESALPAEIVDPPTTTSTTTDVATSVIEMFLVDDSILAAVQREVIQPVEPTAVLEQLLVGPSEDERAEGLTTQLSSGWELRGADLAGRTLVIDLGSETIEVLEGQSQRQAIAQLVLTATSLAGIDDVLIQIDGNPRPLPTDDGEADGATPVDRDDYRSLEPSR
jgi:spore germination protein GerM